MSYFAEQLRKYKDALQEQNEMIIATQNSLKEAKAAYRQMYSGLCQIRAEYNNGKTVIESAVYPDLKPEDPIKLTLDVCQTNVSKALNALTASLGSHRMEFNGFDESVRALQLNEEVDRFNALRLGANSSATSNSFLGNLEAPSDTKRPKTPEVELGMADRLRNVVNPPPTPPESSHGKDKRVPKDKKPTSPTTTFEKSGILDSLVGSSSKQKSSKEEKAKPSGTIKK